MPTAIAIHHPRPEHREAWVATMRQTGDASANIPGLIGAIEGYTEAGGRRLVGISRWESMAALEAGVAGVKKMSDETDRAWGERPTDVLVLSEI